jgi:nucleotide-binding universal stress UspA family protein
VVTHIFVPLDRSEIAEAAIPYANSIALRSGVPVRLLSVIESDSGVSEHREYQDQPPVEEPRPREVAMGYSGSLPFGINPGGEEMTEDEIEEMSRALHQAEAYLEQVRQSFTGVRVETDVIHGDPVQRIVDAGTPRSGPEHDEPIIVMASHGRSGLGRALLGSVAGQVAARAQCPVLIVRGAEATDRSPDEISLRKVVVSLDGTQFSEAIIDPVRNLLGHEGTSFHLVRAVDLDRSWVTGEPAERLDDGRTMREDAEQYLSTMADRFNARGYHTTWDVAEGDPAECITQAAEDTGADLIAMTTHGRSGFERWRMGSVAEGVLGRATRPVLLMRPKQTA